MTSLRAAIGLGGLFAVSTVLPGQIEHLAVHLMTLQQTGWSGVLDHLLPLLGSFLLLSVMSWVAEQGQPKGHPLLAYPPHKTPATLAHIGGLFAGVALLLSHVFRA